MAKNKMHEDRIKSRTKIKALKYTRGKRKKNLSTKRNETNFYFRIINFRFEGLFSFLFVSVSALYSHSENVLLCVSAVRRRKKHT